MNQKIPLLDLQPEIQENMERFVSTFREVLLAGQFIMGKNVSAFESEVAAYVGVKHAVAVNSGTDALVLGLRAMGIKEGDEVITSPFTFFATAEAISACGGKPVFVDIDPRTFNMDPGQVERACTNRSRVIIPVHLYGQTVDMDPINDIASKYGLHVFEDAAQAFGARYKGRNVGTLGGACALSFFPSKNLGAFGDAGMLLTNNDTIAQDVKMLRVHGARKKYYNEVVGYNSRMDELQAALLRVKFPGLDQANAGRARAAKLYDEMLAGIEGVIAPRVETYGTHVFHQYTVRIPNGKRNLVQDALTAEGIGSFVYYPYALHTLPVYKDVPHLDLTQSELAAQEALSLPLWPAIPEGVQRRVKDVIEAALRC